jgi:undecaprenyl-phosphate 4-deoxy-4-formamido-L-arabinose transferase
MARPETSSAPGPVLDDDARPELSVVVTLFEEQATLDELHARLTSALEAFGRAYEVLYVDDGSTDGTFATLQRLHEADPRVRAVRLKRNSGQHPAMHAGLTRIRGAIVVTMDGDLQNPPEDVPRLVEAVEAGYDVASGRRAARHDSWGRTLPSRLINGMLRRFTGVEITDFGCAFNAYRREAVEPMLGAIGRLRLTRLALHVLAGFWPQPIQTAGIVLGTVCSLASLALGVYGLVYWVSNDDFPGPLLLGSLVVAVLGVQGFILALVGEHLGRIQRVVEHRPLYLVDREL